MEYVKLGNTGMDVSRLCLGCMNFGIGGRGHLHGHLMKSAVVQ